MVWSGNKNWKGYKKHTKNVYDMENSLHIINYNV